MSLVNIFLILVLMIFLDIQFFDESIEAKINRYTFRLHKRDTPFLLDSSQKHAKTFVSPAVDVDNLDAIYYPNDGSEEIIKRTQQVSVDKSGRNVFHYRNFPKLKSRNVFTHLTIS